jgi:hypothetical protein
MKKKVEIGIYEGEEIENGRNHKLLILFVINTEPGAGFAELVTQQLIYFGVRRLFSGL